jgi:hypothetical protein
MEALAEIDDERRTVRKQGQQLLADARAQVGALEAHRDDLLARLGALRDELTRLFADAADGHAADAPGGPPRATVGQPW